MASKGDTAVSDPRLAGAPAEVVDAYRRLGGRLKAFALALPMAASQVDAACAVGYSRKTALKSASTYAAMPDVRMVADYLAASAIERAGITLERCMRELAKVAFGDPAAFFGEAGQLLPPQNWPQDAAAMITEIQQVDLLAEGAKIGSVNKIKFADKHAALRTALQLLNAFPEKKKSVTVTKRFGVVVVPAKAPSAPADIGAIDGQAQRIEQPPRPGNAPTALLRKFRSPEAAG